MIELNIINLSIAPLEVLLVMLKVLIESDYSSLFSKERSHTDVQDVKKYNTYNLAKIIIHNPNKTPGLPSRNNLESWRNYNYRLYLEYKHSKWELHCDINAIYNENKYENLGETKPNFENCLSELIEHTYNVEKDHGHLDNVSLQEFSNKLLNQGKYDSIVSYQLQINKYAYQQYIGESEDEMPYITIGSANRYGGNSETDSIVVHDPVTRTHYSGAQLFSDDKQKLKQLYYTVQQELEDNGLNWVIKKYKLKAIKKKPNLSAEW